MAPRLWLWLHVAMAIVAVSCAHHRERHSHTSRSRVEHLNSLGTSLLNVTGSPDGGEGSGRSVLRPSVEMPAQRVRHQSGLELPRRVARRHQRHRHRRRLHSHRGPDIVYSFGSQAAPKLLYRGNKYHVGPYTGYVDVWTIERKPRPPLVPRPEQTTPRPRPSAPEPSHRQQEQQERYPEGTVFARVLIAPETPAKATGCLRCPKDHTVWVGPGFSCAEVPRPRLRGCSRLSRLPGEVHFTATMGPQPGSLVMEGVYQMAFTFKAPGVESQSCQYKLKVKVVRCPALRRPEHGGMRCSRGRHWGSRCRFFCKPGFELSSERVATRCAIHDGARVTWTPHPAPVCRDRNTPRPKPTTNTVVPSTGLPSTAPSTDVSSTSQATEKVPSSPGSPRPPKRRKQLACRWPRAPLHGWVSCDRGAARKPRVVAREGTRCRQGCRWAPQEAVVHFSCVAGAWRGRKPLVCAGPPAASTEGPPQTTERVPRGCVPPLAGPEQHGEWSCGPGDAGLFVAPGGECVFACHRDYDTEEDGARRAVRCMGDRWNHTAAPVCKKSGCESPPPVPQSTLKCSGNPNSLGRWPVHTTCSLLCDEGYEVPASQLSLLPLTCLPGGSWDHREPPQCVRGGCESPVPVPDSALECSSDANHLGNWPAGAVCKVVCAQGFALAPSLQSRDQFICQQDGTWNQTAELQCRRVTCESLREVPNSMLECSGGPNDNGRWSAGTLCQYTCNEGFASPENPVALSCREDGTWNRSTQFHCNGVTCESPQDVVGSVLECSNGTNDDGNWSVGTLCRYTCKAGFAPEDQNAMDSFTCRGDGTWNQTPRPHCRRVTCKSLEDVPDSLLECSDGTIDNGDWSVGTLCRYTCREGFTTPQKGQNVLGPFVCRENGTWNQTAKLQCTRVTCESPPDVSDSRLECTNGTSENGDWSVGTLCRYVCHEGFAALPDNLFNPFICRKDGTWNQTAKPFCRRVTCESPQDVSNSRLECSNGTSDNGKWSIGTLCRYTCNDGFAIPEIQKALNPFHCQGDGTWSLTEQFECKETGCIRPSEVAHSVLNCSEGPTSLGKLPPGTLCSYECNEGYVFEGNDAVFNRFMCREDGTWNQTEELHCRKSGCENPSALQYSMVNCSGSVNNLGRWPTGTVCSHVCHEGYTLAQDHAHLNLFICLHDGTWNQTQGLHCAESGCKDPRYIAHASLNCSSEVNILGKRPSGTHCWHVCEEGFALSSDHEPFNRFTCSEDGSWDQRYDLVCAKTGCETPRLVKDSLLDCSESANAVGNWPTGTTCEHICNEGFVIPRSQQYLNEIVCLNDGSWNETDELQCVKLVHPQLSQGCNDDVVVVDGRNVSFPLAVQAPTFSAFNGTNAAVNCSARELTLYGTFNIVCEAVDVELGTNSTCTYNVIALAPGCPPFQSDPYSVVKCSEVRNATAGPLHPVGDVCEYICHHGYVIPTSKFDWAAKECLPNGLWNNDNFNLCEKQVEPVKESGCEDVELSFDVPTRTAVPVPVYRGASGELVNTTCTPAYVEDFGKHSINCTAEDHELRSSSSCAFKVKVSPGFVTRNEIV